MAKYNPAEATRSILLGQDVEDEQGPPPPPRLGTVPPPRSDLMVAPPEQHRASVATPTLQVAKAEPEGPRMWGSPKGKVWQVHVTLTKEAGDLLEEARHPNESVAAVVIRVLREASDRLAAEAGGGQEEEADFFTDPSPPARRYRVQDGVRKHFDLTTRQREGLTQYMELIGATNLSYVVTRAVELVLGEKIKASRQKK